MRILALDYGDVRTGVAVSDPLEITAQGLKTIKHNGNDKLLLEEISKIISEYNVEKIIIGYPINMNATKGTRAEKTDKFIKKLKQIFEKQIIKIDERLTTVASNRTMAELGINKNKKKNIVDTIAAVYILQMYLNKK